MDKNKPSRGEEEVDRRSGFVRVRRGDDEETGREEEEGDMEG